MAGPIKIKVKRRLLVVVMDGVGVRSSRFGNAVALAKLPNLDALKQNSIYTTLYAHGTSVGLPSDSDIGNSEVGHNALGAGRIFDQGAKLVDKAIESESIFQSRTWKELVSSVKSKHGTLHLIGLLSDGNVHSHEKHLFALLNRAKAEGIGRVRLHVLFDGRDVGEKTAEFYAEHLNTVLRNLNDTKFDAKVASGGGRMIVTMDRYEADWEIVERGWKAHVLGDAPQKFDSVDTALKEFRKDPKLTDQYFPPFVIVEKNQPVGTVEDGDGVVFFNFRGDRAIEICRAFTDGAFPYFDRKRHPKVFFAGMMEYDGDLHIPPHYLVSPPLIGNTLSEYLIKLGVRQYACSETQKFGHVTYFWNGNRSGKFDEALEDYVEIPSDKIAFDLKPKMKAYEITEATVRRILDNTFDFGRINYANGDMVGHTGHLPAAIVSLEAVDDGIGKLVEAAKKTDMILLVTADHGNCDEMFDGKEQDFPDWESPNPKKTPKPKTSHTLSPVPLYIYDPRGTSNYRLTDLKTRTLANVANTCLDLMELPEKADFFPSLIKVKNHGG